MTKTLAMAAALAAVATAVALSGIGLSQESRREPSARVPDFPMKALSSPSATKANFFIAKDGTIQRYTVYVSREGMPEWIHAAADEKIGKGEDLVYECELYPDGSEVYEIYRKINGKEKQLSVHADRSVKYVGTQLSEKELPDKVQSALKEVKGLSFEKCVFKEGPRFAEYHVRGTIGGVQHRVRIAPDGKLLAVQRKIPGEFEVSVQE